MPNIAYYISSHGYGHAARQQAIIKELAKNGAKVYVRTAAPQKFFRQATSYHEQRYDIGMIQGDALHFDIPASLQWYADFHASQETLIQQEVRFIQQEKIQLIVGDMPPIAFEIAERANIPSVAITHFTWDWVYAHYTDDYPQYRYLVDEIRASYNKATLALQMQIPMPHSFDMFPTVEPIPLIYNQATQSRQAIRDAFSIPDEMPMALLSMGGHAWGDSNIRALLGMENWIFLVVPDAWEQVKESPKYFRVIPKNYNDYHNLVAAADLVIGKAGGSTVAEVIGHRTPMIYTTQIGWRESSLLSETLGTYGVAQYVPMEVFMRGEWVDLLAEFSAKPHHFPEVEFDGVKITVERLFRLLEESC